MPRIKVDQKIIGYGVVKEAAGPTQAEAPKTQAANRARAANRSPADGQKVIRMHEKLERPEMLVGSTYKVKTPVSDHAMYVTINDIILNEGTEFEKRRPFEIFINSKNLDHYQWIVALTRIMSAVFRKGGDVAFLVDELKAVFDPRGGYWQPGGKFMPSIIAELGYIVERHLKHIGLIGPSGPSDEQRKALERKRAEFQARSSQQDAFAENSFPAGAQLCAKCNTAASVMLDGCLTCLDCGYSRCG
ncbi:MAG: hypothetical protein OXI73_08535 [Rhodospirillales bacterium]|nr:hypothetical protein [Rhodospirillales bacterium]